MNTIEKNLFESLEDTFKNNQSKEDVCRHTKCKKCKGTGRDSNGNLCIHMISCPCKKCTPYSL